MADLRITVRTTGARGAAQKLARARKEARELAKANRELQQAQNRNTKATRDGIVTTEKFGEEQIRLRHRLTASSGRLKVLGRDINRYITIPFLAFTGASAKFASDLNRAMGNVQALIPGTGDRINELTQDIRTMAAESGRSFQDLSDGLYRTVSVFQDTEETVDRLNIAVRMGIAGYASTAESVQLLSSVTRAYGDTSAAAVQRVADLAFETVRLGDTTIPALSAAMQVATDRADRLAVSQEELFAVFSSLTGITGDASMVATQFRSAMDSLLNPTDALKDLLHAYGFASAEAAIESRGLAGTLTMIAREAERTGRPLQEFITRKEGVTLVSRLAGQQLGTFNERLRANVNAAGAADESYKEVTEGVARWTFRLDQNTRALQANFSEIGDNVLPVIATFVGFLADLVETFNLLPVPIQATIGVLFTLISTLGIVLQVMGAIKGLHIATMFFDWGKAITQAGLMTAKTVVILKTALGVLGLISAAIAVVAVAWVNHERNKAQAIERTNDTLQKQLDLQRDMARQASRLRRSEMQTGAAYLTEQYTDIGTAPGFRIATHQEVGPGVGVIEYQTLEKTTDAIDLNNSSLGQLQDTYKGLSGIMSEFNRNAATTETEIDKLSKNFDTLAATIKEAGDSYATSITNVLDRRSLAEFNDEATTTAERIQILQSNLDKFRRTEGSLSGLAGAYGRGAVRPGAGMHPNDIQTLKHIEEVLGLLRKQRDLENQIQGIRDASFSEDRMERYTELLAALNAVERRILEMGGNLPGGGSGQGVRMWEEWFEDITGVGLLGREGWRRHGAEAAQALGEAFSEELEFERMLAEALGDDFTESEAIRGQIESIPKFINEMLNEIDPSEIDDPFEWVNAVIQKMIELSGELKQAEATAMVNELSQAWDNQADSMERLNQVIDQYGLDMDQVSMTKQDFLDRVDTGTELLNALVNNGIDPSSEAFKELSRMIEQAREQAKAFKATYQELNDVFSGGPDISGGVARFAFTAMFEGFDVAIEQAREVTREFSLLEITGYAAAEALGMAMTTAVNGLVGAFHNLGRAIAGATNENESFQDSLRSMGMALLNMLPQLMINAGLMLISTLTPQGIAIGLGLVAAGLAGNIGLGYAEGVRDREAEQRRDSATTTLARGGVLHTPTRWGEYLAGEAGAEAVMPLTRTRSGDLGVHVEGAGVAAKPVTVNIHNYAGVEVEESVDENTGNIDVIITRAMQNIISSGGVDKQMRRYNVRPRGM